MKLLRLSALMLAGIISQNVISAVKIVECEDEQGNKVFRATCLPGEKMVDQRRVLTGTKSADETPVEEGEVSISATLYFIPECESCDIVRDYLMNRNVNLTQKNVMTDVDLQTEMKDVSGQQSVPVTVIGEKVLIGYNATQLKAALVEAGYTEDQVQAQE